jgi:hypothetical protein
MPANYFIIEDTSNHLFMISYSEVLENCGWGNILSAVHFTTQQAADDAIAAWGLGSQSRYIGENPKPH